MAQIPGSIRVGGFIAPSDDADTYSSHDAKYGRDGLRSVADNTERNAITADRRREGMLVFCRDSKKYFTLLAGPWDNTDADWEEFNTAKAGPKYVHEQAIPLAVWSINHNLGTYPAVVVVDSANSQITTDVDYVDVNNLIVSAASPFAGTARLF